MPTRFRGPPRPLRRGARRTFGAVSRQPKAARRSKISKRSEVMETARNGASGRAAERDARSLKRAAREAAERAAGNPEVEKLIADVEALIDRVSDAADPAVAHLCAKVADAVASAKRAVNERATLVQRQARDALAAGDVYVHEQPWEAIGVAAVAGLVIGMLVFRR